MHCDILLYFNFDVYTIPYISEMEYLWKSVNSKTQMQKCEKEINADEKLSHNNKRNYKYF